MKHECWEGITDYYFVLDVCVQIQSDQYGT